MSDTPAHDESVEVAVGLPPRQLETLDAIAAVYETDREEILRQALSEHIDDMLDRRQTLRQVARAYLEGDIANGDLELLFGARTADLAIEMKNALEERDTSKTSDREE